MNRGSIVLGLLLAGFAAAPFASAQTDFSERPRAVLFDGASFGGAPQPVVRETSNLSSVGFNDRASSIDVRAGDWQICAGRGFSGHCEILMPGRHELAALGLDNRISSLRPVTHENEAQMRAPIVLHTKRRFEGEMLTVEQDYPDLGAVAFDDMARSVTINSGVWEVCDEPDYLGDCSYMRGSEPNLGAIDLSRKVSSLRMVPELKAPEEYGLVLYPERNFKGAYRGLDGSASSLIQLRFDDRARSIRVNHGEWLVCESAGFLGRCEIVRKSVKDLRQLDLAFRISSVRPYTDPAIEIDQATYTPSATLSHDGEATVFFPRPEVNGLRIDQCSETGECGDLPAQGFCDRKGYSGLVYFGVKEGLAETGTVSGRKICSNGACTALSDVLCLK